MHQDNHVSKKAINVTGVTKNSLKVKPAIKLALEYYAEGWVIKVRRIKGRLYLYARKYDRKKKERVWKYLSPITEEEVEFLKKLGVVRVTSVPHSDVPHSGLGNHQLGNNNWGTISGERNVIRVTSVHCSSSKIGGEG